MTTVPRRKEALEALLEKVEAGNWPYEGGKAFRDEYDHTHAVRAFTGSLDAAIALHEAVMPGWCWRVECHGVAFVFSEQGEFMGITDIPARALLIAILKALIAQEEV